MLESLGCAFALNVDIKMHIVRSNVYKLTDKYPPIVIVPNHC